MVEDQSYLDAYFSLMETGELLRGRVEQQLKRDGELSYIQFRILARLVESELGQMRMTDLAHGVVYSRSGLTYQAGILERDGLILRSPAPDDDRSTLVSITTAGRARIEEVVPGHFELLRNEFYAELSDEDVLNMADTLGRVRERLRAIPERSPKASSASDD